jgi:general secretion pathway protein D
MKQFIRTGALVIGLVGLTGCAALESSNKFKVRPSLFESADDIVGNKNTVNVGKDKKNTTSSFTRIQSMAEQFGVADERPKVAATFSETDMVRFSVDKMKLNEFIHHVFGGVLGVNYVLSNELTEKVEPVTLNFQNDISKKQAFLATSEVLTSKAVGVSVKDGAYYLYPLQSGAPGDINIGVGRHDNDLPLVGNNILQIFPMNYGVTIGVERTLRQLTDIAVSVDLDQGAVFLQGDRAKVKKVMELARILDLPSNKGKHIGLLKLTYISTEEFSEQVAKLLKSEGIPIGVGEGKQKNVVLVPINQIGLVAVFSSNAQFLKRVQFWQTKLDKPAEGNEKRYFMYEPRNARASDLGESLTPLFGGTPAKGGAAKGNSSRDTRSALATGSASNAGNKATAVVTNELLTMVVDERTNTLIFYTTGKQYQKVLPLVKRMDTLPRQVILEATIAEVTLTDGFKHGVEFAMKNGDFGYTSAFNPVDTGLGAAWSTLDAAGNIFEEASINLVQSDSLINILSNPSLLVRDGVRASITVGDEIPLATGSISDPLDGNNPLQRNTIERRQTGLILTVTPTINSQGIVIMEISLTMTNADGQNLLNRQVTTEVVANSGQTVILAGLISQKNTGDGTQVPGLGDIPLLGHLFKSTSKSTTKTELVILVTPKIINDGNQWGDIKNKFRKGLENVEF